MILTVYYEDQRGVAAKGYGPHDLLVSCLVDDLPERDRWALARTVIANPRKGDGKLLRALREDGPAARVAGGVLAMLDHDRIRRTLNLRGDACKVEVLRCLAHDHQVSASEIVLLEENTETLIEAACVLLGTPPPSNKPSPDERDRILGKLSWHPDRIVRDRLRQTVPSFHRLVCRAAAALGSSS